MRKETTLHQRQDHRIQGFLYASKRAPRSWRTGLGGWQCSAGTTRTPRRAAFYDATAHQTADKSRNAVFIETPPSKMVSLANQQAGPQHRQGGRRRYQTRRINQRTTTHYEARGVRNYTLRIGSNNGVTCGHTIPIMLPLDRATDGDAEATTVAAADTNMYNIQFNSTCLDAPLH